MHRFKQTPDDHGIGNIGNLHFIEAQQPGFLGKLIGDLADGSLLRPGLVDNLHEGMEMQALFGPTFDVFKEQIHQHGFAAPDIAMNIEALGHWLWFTEQAKEAAVFQRRGVSQRVGEFLQMPDNCSLGIIRLQLG